MVVYGGTLKFGVTELCPSSRLYTLESQGTEFENLQTPGTTKCARVKSSYNSKNRLEKVSVHKLFLRLDQLVGAT